AAAAGDFEDKLAAVVRRRLPGCRGLVAAERLSGGASQETYRLVLATDAGERRACLRRAPGGVVHADSPNPGLATEALLMQVARQAGVPEPEVHYVLEPGDGLGEGFIMQ